MSFRSRQMYFYGSISLNCFENDKSFSGRENGNIFYVQQISNENCAFDEITWKNTVEPDRSQITITLYMHFAYWIAKPKNTHSYLRDV